MLKLRKNFVCCYKNTGVTTTKCERVWYKVYTKNKCAICCVPSRVSLYSYYKLCLYCFFSFPLNGKVSDCLQSTTVVVAGKGLERGKVFLLFLDHRRKTNLLRACQNLLTLIRTVVMNSLLSIGPQYHSRIGSQDN